MNGRGRRRDGRQGKSSTDEEGEEDGPRPGFELLVLSQRGGCSRAVRIEGTSRRESEREEVGRVTRWDEEKGVRQSKERSKRKKKKKKKKKKRKKEENGPGGTVRGFGGEGGKTLHEGLEM
ncbi:uncharacterized protein LOC143264405 [Megachile rotundata]|uniref:uncharacterized protein LOC143264405 n=1 Tax=Megachile rotundata TaxID=143995 RepID=UPI003FD3A15B